MQLKFPNKQSLTSSKVEDYFDKDVFTYFKSFKEGKYQVFDLINPEDKMDSVIFFCEEHKDVFPSVFIYKLQNLKKEGRIEVIFNLVKQTVSSRVKEDVIKNFRLFIKQKHYYEKVTKELRMVLEFCLVNYFCSNYRPGNYQKLKKTFTLFSMMLLEADKLYHEYQMKEYSAQALITQLRNRMDQSDMKDS